MNTCKWPHHLGIPLIPADMVPMDDYKKKKKEEKMDEWMEVTSSFWYIFFTNMVPMGN